MVSTMELMHCTILSDRSVRALFSRRFLASSFPALATTLLSSEMVSSSAIARSYLSARG